MLSFPSAASDIYFRDWRAINAEYVLIGRAGPGSPGKNLGKLSAV